MSMFEIPETQWVLLCDPEVIRKLAHIRTREELMDLAEELVFAPMDDESVRGHALDNLSSYLVEAKAF